MSCQQVWRYRPQAQRTTYWPCHGVIRICGGQKIHNICPMAGSGAGQMGGSKPQNEYRCAKGEDVERQEKTGRGRIYASGEGVVEGTLRWRVQVPLELRPKYLR